MTFYRRNLPHIQHGTTTLFVTFRTYKHYKLSPRLRSIVLDHCLYDHGRRYELHAAVVMINHVHLLFSPLLDAKGEAFKLADIMKALKGSSARSINKATFDYGSYWQDESFDHLVRTAEDFGRHYEYILVNAAQVTPGSNPYDYPWLWTPSKAQTGVSVPPEKL